MLLSAKANKCTSFKAGSNNSRSQNPLSRANPICHFQQSVFVFPVCVPLREIQQSAVRRAMALRCHAQSRALLRSGLCSWTQHGKLTVAQMAKTSPPAIEPKGSLPCAQNIVCGPCSSQMNPITHQNPLLQDTLQDWSAFLYEFITKRMLRALPISPSFI